MSRIITMVLFLLTSILWTCSASGLPDNSLDAFFLSYTGSYDYDTVSNASKYTPDGGYIVVNNTAAISGGNSQIRIEKYTQSLDYDWALEFGNTSNDYSLAVDLTSDGHYLIGGYSSSYGAGNNDVLLIKWWSSEIAAWAVASGGTGDDRGLALEVTPDDGCMVAGYTSSYGAGGFDALVLRYDADGSIMWARTAGGPGIDRANALELTSDGGCLVCGSTSSYGAGSLDFLILKYDAIGNLEWAETAGTSNSETCSGIRKTPDGGFITCGNTSAGPNDMLVIKFDASHVPVWYKTAGSAGFDSAAGLDITPTGGYAIAGYSNGIGTGSDEDGVIVRFSGTGDFEGASLIGGIGDDRLYSIQSGSQLDTGFFCTGSGQYYLGGEFESIAARTNPMGLVPGCSRTVICSPTIGTPAGLTAALQTVSESNPPIIETSVPLDMDGCSFHMHPTCFSSTVPTLSTVGMAMLIAVLSILLVRLRR